MVTLGRPVIVRTAQRVERTANIVELQTILQKLPKVEDSDEAKTTAKMVDDTISKAATIGASATVGKQMNQIKDMVQRHSIYDANYDSDSDDVDDNCVSVTSDNDNIKSGAGKNAYTIRKHRGKNVSGFGERLHYQK